MVWWTSANCISSFMHFDNHSFLTKSLYFQQCVRQFTAGEKVKFTKSPSMVSHHSSRNKSSSQEVWGCPNTYWSLQTRTAHWMGNILGTGHLGMRIASSRYLSRGWRGRNVTRSAGHGDLQSRAQSQSGPWAAGRRGEVLVTQHRGSGLVLCPVRAQQCQHFHKTPLGYRTPLLEWLSEQQDTSKLLIKTVTTTPKSHQWREGMHCCCHWRRVLWPSMSADFFQLLKFYVPL